MLIVEVKKNKRTEYSIIFENGDNLAVTEDTLVKYRLLKGIDLSEKKFSALKEDADFTEGLKLAYHHLSFQLRTTKEVFDYLKSKKVKLDFIEKIIEKLRLLKLIDDLAYAQSFVRTKVSLSIYGPTKIREKLLLKGVPDNLITASLADNYSEEQQKVNAQKLVEKLLLKNQKKSFNERILKIKQNLMASGYSSSMAETVLAEIKLERDEDAEWVMLSSAFEKIVNRLNQDLPYFKRKQKLMQSMYQKGFDLPMITKFLEENYDS